uniref:Small open reading frame n=1 Tax=Babesia bovis TaxID=5865 RepID=S6B1U1_BABBO|nr:small open reading frame [Babesia bovis]
MVTFNILWKLCLVVAFGLSATVTATDVAQEQPKKESVISGSLRKNEESDTKLQEAPKASNTDKGTCGLPNYDVEWLLESKPENRAALRKALPSDIAKDVPEDYKKRMWSGLEEYIFKFFNIYATGWYLLPEPESRAALRFMLPSNLAAKVPEDCNEPIDPELEQEIKKLFSKKFQKQRKRCAYLGGHMF